MGSRASSTRNKSDMLDARKVAAEEARTYAKENNLFFMETSAKTANNVNDLFYEIAQRYLFCSRPLTRQAWFLWIDLQTGLPVLLVAHETECIQVILCHQLIPFFLWFAHEFNFCCAYGISCLPCSKIY
ncbi:ras-related protein RHN1-like isoform X1 [Primulina eburnea]|uniref:ras-related protein RHN1-like isoform X1 n=1 Tax=Primulina eburnea TaxID=1245227 RepID=UPI003C6C9431